MASGASTGSHAQRAKRQIQVIQHDNNAIGRDLVKSGQRRNGFATYVHVALRLAQQESCISLIALGQVGGKFFIHLPIQGQALGQALKRHEPDVVSGAGIFPSGIAQTHDEECIFHGRPSSKNQANGIKQFAVRTKSIFLLFLCGGFALCGCGLACFLAFSLFGLGRDTGGSHSDCP